MGFMALRRGWIDHLFVQTFRTLFDEPLEKSETGRKGEATKKTARILGITSPRIVSVLKAQRILNAITWATLVVGLIAFLRPNGLLDLGGLILGSLAVSAVSSLMVLGLSFKTRTGWLLAFLSLFGIAGLAWWIWEIVTHLPVA